MKSKVVAPLVFLLSLSSLMSCSGKKDKANILIEEANSQLSFAKDQIESALAKAKGTGKTVDIKINNPTDTYGYEEYKVTVEDNTITIDGGDYNALMYGAFDLADKIRFNDGVSNIESFTGSPDIEQRGIKFDLPLDMRTPSYGDQADSAQDNMENIWTLDFWKEELDAMALDKYNALTVWSLNPFPSMCKVPEYPDVALDDVWKTNIKFDDTYNGVATNFVRDEHWIEGNYTVVKKMTIDEKIEHWKNVISYAHSRGIKFYIMTWNIYTYGEHGKYGIDNSVDNTVTKDYYRKSVKAMFDCYPELDGIGCTAGENMDWSNEEDTKNEQWLYDTFGMGINDYLSTNPNRDITLLHRLHFAEFEMIETLWKDFKGNLVYSDNYSKAHMYSSRKPTYTDEIFPILPSDKRIFLELRTDDFYIHRYGNPNFVRDYLQNMPGKDKVRGVWVGGDGYCRGVDYSSKDPDFNNRLHYKKDWFNNATIGRLAYNKHLDNEYFINLLQAHFSSIESSRIENLFNSMINAGEILPEVTMQYFLNGDAAWYPEGGFGHSTMNGFISLKKLINANNVMQDSGRVGFGDYAKAIKENRLSEYSNMITPDKVIKNINLYAENALEFANLAKNNFKPKGYEEKEFLATIIDQEEFAMLGQYYADKFDANLDLRQYNDTNNKAMQESAKAKMELAVAHYSDYASSYSSRYIDTRLGRAGDFHINDVLNSVKDDISIIEKWAHRDY